jgi:hypothetical protein
MVELYYNFCSETVSLIKHTEDLDLEDVNQEKRFLIFNLFH